ncbi:MAG: response regulator [Planctomycetota bacterium]|jgi:diguanylate cyclase (GGDEF)-like protein
MKPPTQQPIVLIIDDDTEILDLLKCSLERDFVVITRPSAENVEDLLEELSPNLLVTDLCMPGIDGLELCRRIRCNPVYDFLPIVFLSAYDAPEYQEKAFAAGCDDYLSKPFQRAELTTKLTIWSRMAMRCQQIMRNNERLKQMLQLDSLTGLYSRRFALDLLEDEVARCRRYRTPLTVLMVDIDGFKEINSVHGHAAGDRALQEVANTIQASLRKVDRIARFGGDEFLLLLPNSGMLAAEAVCRKLQASPVLCDLHPDQTLELTLSIGGADIEGAQSASELIDAATLALLVAKQRGRGNWHLSFNQNDQLDELQELQVTRNSMRSILCSTFSSLLVQLDRIDDTINDRCDLMQALTTQMAAPLGLSTEERFALQNAIRLCHFDRINMSWEIESKWDTLLPEQQQELKRTLAHNLVILRQTGFLNAEAEILAHRYEWMDGSGFPEGLSGPRIPLATRLLTLVSAFSQLRMGRGESEGLMTEAALERVGQEAGTHFDPALIPPLREAVRHYYHEEEKTSARPILLVEDYAPIASIITRMLAGSGYTISHACNVKEARTLLPTQPWEAILLDLMMPGESGAQYLEELSQQAREREIPFAVVSARTDEEAIGMTREAGAFAYIIKPIRMEKMRQALRHSRQQKGTGQSFVIIRP